MVGFRTAWALPGCAMCRPNGLANAQMLGFNS